MSFEVQSPGKWILAGEHSVLRGSPALVFPLHAKQMGLRYQERQGVRQCRTSASYGEDIAVLFWGVLKRACEIANCDEREFDGEYELFGDLPLGSGLGASAALCVSLGRLLQKRGYVGEDNLYDFCRELENLFHGESSGLDIAVALFGRGLRFVRSEGYEPLQPKWQPQCYLSYSGQRGITSECVAQVKAIFDLSPERGARIDDQMKSAVGLCFEALHCDANRGMPLLAEGLQKAGSCFFEWGLVDERAQAKMDALLKAGAIAVKPTGSGGGGYILSLWDQAPPERLLANDLIPCFS